MVRVLGFEAPLDDASIEALMRDEIMPDLTLAPGLERAIFARRSTDQRRDYLLITLWQGAAEMTDAVRDGVAAVYQPAFAPYLRFAVVSAFEVEDQSIEAASEALTMVRVDRARDAGQTPDRPEDGLATRRVLAGPDEAAPSLVLSGSVDGEPILVAGWSSDSRASREGAYSVVLEVRSPARG